jgi:hypothetical protein
MILLDSIEPGAVFQTESFYCPPLWLAEIERCQPYFIGLSGKH